MKTQYLEKVREMIKTTITTVWIILTCYLMPTSKNKLLKNMNFYALMYGHSYRWIGIALFFLIAIFGPKKEINPEAFDFAFTSFMFFCVYITLLHFSIRKRLPFRKPTIEGNSFRINIK